MLHGEKLHALFIKSKCVRLYSGLVCTRVLAVCEAGTPLALEVEAGQFGEVVSPGDAEALRDVLDRWSSDPKLLLERGANALIWSRRYKREAILPQYEAALAELVV